MEAKREFARLNRMHDRTMLMNEIRDTHDEKIQAKRRYDETKKKYFLPDGTSRGLYVGNGTFYHFCRRCMERVKYMFYVDACFMRRCVYLRDYYYQKIKGYTYRYDCRTCRLRYLFMDSPYTGEYQTGTKLLPADKEPPKCKLINR